MNQNNYPCPEIFRNYLRYSAILRWRRREKQFGRVLIIQGWILQKGCSRIGKVFPPSSMTDRHRVFLRKEVHPPSRNASKRSNSEFLRTKAHNFLQAPARISEANPDA